MFKIKKKSGWTFVTSAGGSVGAQFIAVAKGHFTLKASGGGNVAWWAHIGGFAIGAALVWHNAAT